MPAPRQTGRQRRYIFSTHPFVCVLQTCAQDILKTNEPVWNKWCTGEGHETIDLVDQEVRGPVHTRPENFLR